MAEKAFRGTALPAKVSHEPAGSFPAEPGTLGERLAMAGVSRRSLLSWAAGITSVMALPPVLAPEVAHAVETARKPTLVWLEFQDCTGDTESFLRSRSPGVGDLILDIVSVDYHETIMAASGAQAEESLAQALADGGHIVVVEGSAPLGADGAYCVIGGRTAVQRLTQAAEGAVAIVNVGTCSAYGGLPAAAPNPTGAVGVSDVVKGVPIINRTHPIQRGALYKLGCKGPSTWHNCPIQQWNDRTSWPIGVGSPCVGCSEPAFWDTMMPMYDRLPHVSAAGHDLTADKIGLSLVGATFAGATVHGVAKVLQQKRYFAATWADAAVPVAAVPVAAVPVAAVPVAAGPVAAGPASAKTPSPAAPAAVDVDPKGAQS